MYCYHLCGKINILKSWTDAENWPNQVWWYLMVDYSSLWKICQSLWQLERKSVSDPIYLKRAVFRERNLLKWHLYVWECMDAGSAEWRGCGYQLDEAKSVSTDVWPIGRSMEFRSGLQLRDSSHYSPDATELCKCLEWYTRGYHERLLIPIHEHYDQCACTDTLDCTGLWEVISLQTLC